MALIGRQVADVMRDGRVDPDAQPLDQGMSIVEYLIVEARAASQGLSEVLPPVIVQRLEIGRQIAVEIEHAAVALGGPQVVACDQALVSPEPGFQALLPECPVTEAEERQGGLIG